MFSADSVIPTEASRQEEFERVALVARAKFGDTGAPLPGRKHDFPGVVAKSPSHLSSQVAQHRDELNGMRKTRQIKARADEESTNALYRERLSGVQPKAVSSLPASILAARVDMYREKERERDQRSRMLAKESSVSRSRYLEAAPRTESQLSLEVLRRREEKARAREAEAEQRRNEERQRSRELKQMLKNASGRDFKSLSPEVQAAREELAKQRQREDERRLVEEEDRAIAMMELIESAQSRTVQKLDGDIERRWRSLKQQSEARRQEAAAETRKGAREFIKSLSDTQAKTESSLSPDMLALRAEKALRMQREVEDEAHRLALENYEARRRNEDATTRTTHKLSDEMAGLRDLMIEKEALRRGAAREKAQENWDKLKVLVREKEPVTEVKHSETLMEFKCRLERDLEERKKAQAAQMKKENAETRERLSRMDSIVSRNIAQAKRARAAQRRDEVKAEMVRKDEELAELERVKLGAETAWQWRDAGNDVAHVEEIQAKIAAVKKQKRQLRWKLGATTALASTAEGEVEGHLPIIAGRRPIADGDCVTIEDGSELGEGRAPTVGRAKQDSLLVSMMTSSGRQARDETTVYVDAESGSS